LFTLRAIEIQDFSQTTLNRGQREVHRIATISADPHFGSMYGKNPNNLDSLNRAIGNKIKLVKKVASYAFVGEFASQSSPVGVCQLYITRMDTCIWIWAMKNTLELSLARFNMYDIYIMYKKAPVHWTLLRHA